MQDTNVTFTGDHLWTNAIVAEVFPTAVTPSTWSVWHDFFSKLMVGDVATIGLIGGCLYLNYSLTYSFALKMTRSHERAMRLIGDSIGVPPAGVSVPSFPISWRNIIFQVLVQEVKGEIKKSKLEKRAVEYLGMVQKRCQELRGMIEVAPENELIGLWEQEIRPLWNEIHFLQDRQNERVAQGSRWLKTELTKLLSEDDANLLLSTITSAGDLASIGPLVGLLKLSRGELSREEYLRQYGHRGPNENELAEPRQSEDPGWVDRQLAEFKQSSVDLAERMAKRETESAAVLEDIKRRLPPKKGRTVERKVRELVEANSLREATRSELTRLVSVIRAWFLRTGELSGLGDGVFFLGADEVVAVLSGDTSSALQVPARREAYERYRTLPSLPMWIRGRFDPFQWAADPNRRREFFDPQAQASGAAPGTSRVIKGHPGSAGFVEGTVRRIDSPEEGDQLQPGEILVTSTTNVGWTPLFPRAAAVVTDFGGSLSHAAIVARELGIPAVVGSGDATIRLKTGDRVQVDGSKGTVELLGNA